MKKTIKITALLSVLILIVMSLGACGSSMKNAAVERMEYSASKSAADGASYDFGSEESFVEPGEPAPDAKDTEADVRESRKLVRNVDLSMQTKEFDAVVDSIEKKVKRYGGYIEEMMISGNTYYNPNGCRDASMTLRIPESKLDEFLEECTNIAVITSKSVSVSDITSQYIDTESRISALKAEQKALTSILEKAKTVEETLQVYERLSEVNASLESYESKLKTFDNQVSFSEIRISLDEVEKVTVTEKEGYWAEIGRKLSDNLHSVGLWFRNVSIWFISSLPQLLIAAVIITAAILIIKKAVKARKGRKLSNSEKKAEKKEEKEDTQKSD